MAWRLTIFLVTFLVTSISFAQTETIYYRQGNSWRGYTGTVTAPICSLKLCNRYPMVSWDSYFEEFAAWKSTTGDPQTASSFLNFRVMFPPGYNINDNTKKYPIILMLHGAGESGRVWTGRYVYDPTDPRYDNNSHNLLHGGNEHRLAVQRPATDPRSFPGILVFPQVSYSGAWGDSDNLQLSENEEFVTRFLEEQIVNVYHGDINRIYVHGLSNGAKGSWSIAMKRPDLFAAIHPMSGIPNDNNLAAPRLVNMPIRLSQGGLDTNPSPGGAQSILNALIALGGNPQLFYYPTLGHGTWVQTYSEPDFFSWFLSKNKRQIYVYGGDPSICPGQSSLKLGFSEGMSSYQWMLNGAPIAGATGRDLANISQIGTYSVIFTRPNGTTDVSEEVVVTNKTGSDFKPTLTYSGSLNIPIVTGTESVVNNVILTAPFGYSQYSWYKNGYENENLIATGTSNTRLVSTNNGLQSDAGSYTVVVTELSGCKSLHSEPVTLVWGNTTSPGIPGTPTVTSLSPTQTRVTWTDNIANELKFEIWRYRFGPPNQTNGYSALAWRMVGTVPANTTSFDDIGLSPGSLYHYRIRAIGPVGAQLSSARAHTMPADNIPPTAPLNLTASNVTDSQVTLTWEASTDNDQIYKYQIYSGSTLLQTISGSFSYSSSAGGSDTFTRPATSFTVTGLAPGTTYFFSVRALDFINPNTTDDALRNYSPFSEVLEVTTQGPINGLIFKYYTTTGLSGTGAGPTANQLAEPYTTLNGPNFNFSTAIPKQTGVVSNFSISGANTFQNSTDPNNFVYAFDGFIQVPTTGNYRFFTRSDDGSRMYLNGTLIVNNDGAHGAINASSNSINLTAGIKYPIRVTFFENGGGQELGVRHTFASGTPSSTYPTTNTIQDSWLFQTGATITTYYLRTGTGDPSLNTSWTTNVNGSGGTTPPASVFSQNNTFFILANRASVDISSAWSVTGSGSKVVAGNGSAITVNINNAVNATMEASTNAIVNVNHTTIPKFNVMDANSIINFNVSGINIPGASYGHVNLVSSGSYNLSLSTTIIKGNLTIANGATTIGVANNLTTLRIGGNLIVNNTTGNPLPGVAGQQYSLIFTGGVTHNVSFVNPVDPNLFSIQADFGDIISFIGLSGRTFTVGSNQGGGLILKGGSSLNLGNNHLIVTGRGTINSNTETGVLNMTGGNLTFISSATQNSNIYFGTGNSLNNLTSSVPVNNRNSILSAVSVNNLVTVSSGDLYTGEGYLTLRSTGDAAGFTARIGPLLNGAKVSGKITVERYMSGEGRIYRYISSPVRNVTAADLQAFFPITGNFQGASVISGVTSNASMFHYNETLNPQYQQFPSVGGSNLETLQRGKGYTPFIREAGAPTTWVTTGEPYQGNIPFTLTGGTGLTTNGWNLLGNPYPAPIQWTGNSTGGWTLSGVNSVIYIRENDTSIPGGFRWRSSDGSLGLPFDGTIAPGQAFWVRTTTANPTLIISESAKKITDGAFYREGAPENLLEITMKSASAEDATYIRFVDEATPAFDTNIDGVKQDNSYFNLSSLTSDGKPMAINLTTTNYCEQEIKLRTSNAPVGTYELIINGSSSIISGDEVTFTDNLTQTEKVISDTEVYSFSITDDPASKADGRFTLRMKKPAVVLNQTLKADAACEQTSPIIKVNNSQPGVTYQAFVDGVAISEGFTSVGGTLELAVNPALVAFGSTPAMIKAGFKGCNNFELPMTIAVQRDTLPVPEIMIEPLKLIASTENANYIWYFNGEELEGQTSQELLAPEDGQYVVEVTRASCIKKSDTVEYAAGRITGIEKPNRLQQLFPNPTRDKVVITMEQPIDFPSIRVITTIGQSMQIQTTRISKESAEVDFSQLPTGLYLLQVNGQRYRVLKE